MRTNTYFYMCIFNIIPIQVSLKTLSASPTTFIPCLLKILSDYELHVEEYGHSEFYGFNRSKERFNSYKDRKRTSQMMVNLQKEK
ncbi:hypothetical protein BDF21DRAFT_123861 [Thamnidium elegans]|nr:hypothetical protein BDF21DRAFT_123861 [Thamnidium elegans]